MNFDYVLSSSETKAQVSFSVGGGIGGVVVVNFSHFLLLIKNHWANFDGICSMCIISLRIFFFVRGQEIINFMAPTPVGGNFGVKNVKFMYFFSKIFFSILGHGPYKLSV